MGDLDTLESCLRRGQLHCYGGEGCYSNGKWCDGYKDCENGFDERNCYNPIRYHATTARPHARYTISYKTSYHNNNHSGHATFGPIIGVSSALAVLVILVCCCMAAGGKKRSPGTTNDNRETATPSAPPLSGPTALSQTTFMTDASAYSLELRVDNPPQNVNNSVVSENAPPSYDTLFPRPSAVEYNKCSDPGTSYSGIS